MTRLWTDYKKTFSTENLIFDFARTGDVEMLKNLADIASVINVRNNNGHSALMIAAYNGNLSTAKFLLESGADPNTSDLAGSTVLMGAAFKGDLAMLKLLIDNGASVKMHNAKNQTALSFAEMFEKKDAVDLLQDNQN